MGRGGLFVLSSCSLSDEDDDDEEAWLLAFLPASLSVLALTPPLAFSVSESELSDEDDDEDEDEEEDDDEEDEELELLLFCCWPEVSISGFPFTAVFPLVGGPWCRSWTDDGDWPRNRSPGGSLLCDWLVIGDLERTGGSRER